MKREREILGPTSRLAGTFALALTGLLLAAPVAGAQEAKSADQALERVMRILDETPLIDGHNDLPWVIRRSKTAPHDVRAYDLRERTTGHTDLERLRKGRVGAQFWSVYIPSSAVRDGAARVQLEQFDIIHQIIDLYPDHFELALTASDIERIYGSGKIASLIGMEGGHAIENSLGALRAFYNLGARYLTLTHNSDIDWADAGTDDGKHNGLTEFGKEVVREMNWLGMMVDLSHVAPSTMHAALDVSEAPVIFSHSSARAVTDHPRNVPDDVLKRISENGGIVMATIVPRFVSEKVNQHKRGSGPTPEATMDDFIAHIEHLRKVAGIDHIGIGGDYDGISSTPVGLEDVSTYPALLAELARRGWSDDDLRKFAGENMLRVMRETEAVSRKLQRQRGPSMKTIEELDGFTRKPIT